MKILYLGYGYGALTQRYNDGDFPSHPLYGYVELKNKGEDVAYKKLPSGGVKEIVCFVIQLLRSKCDVIVIPYIYEGALLGLVLLKKMNLLRTPIIAISHKAFNTGSSSMKKRINKWLYQSFDKILFHSPLNMEESKKTGWVDFSKMEIVHWGVDLKYYEKFDTSEFRDEFVSTGREKRDFKILIDVFSKINSSLHIYTNSINYEKDYTFLSQYIGKYSNMNIQLVDNSKTSAIEATQIVAESFCILIPVLSDALSYCVGHTSIVEALALGKPIIATRNPYHPIDIEKEGVGLLVSPDDMTSWLDAITYLANHKEKAKQMGEKALILARQAYNIEMFANEIHRYCHLLVKKV